MCAEDWLVPSQAPRVEEFAPSAPTMSGLMRPSGVGPRLLRSLISVVLFQAAAPTASSPAFELSAGLSMLPLPVLC